MRCVNNWFTLLWGYDQQFWFYNCTLPSVCGTQTHFLDLSRSLSSISFDPSSLQRSGSVPESSFWNFLSCSDRWITSSTGMISNNASLRDAWKVNSMRSVERKAPWWLVDHFSTTCAVETNLLECKVYQKLAKCVILCHSLLALTFKNKSEFFKFKRAFFRLDCKAGVMRYGKTCSSTGNNFKGWTHYMGYLTTQQSQQLDCVSEASTL